MGDWVHGSRCLVCKSKCSSSRQNASQHLSPRSRTLPPAPIYCHKLSITSLTYHQEAHGRALRQGQAQVTGKGAIADAKASFLDNSPEPTCQRRPARRRHPFWAQPRARTRQVPEQRRSSLARTRPLSGECWTTGEAAK
ncbi:hypothetical protein M758_2G106700 [Ceratodon purpureus]|nr:hypothetical protein M758_2G106700 [Ceratodon purpureus]